MPPYKHWNVEAEGFCYCCFVFSNYPRKQKCSPWSILISSSPVPCHEKPEFPRPNARGGGSQASLRLPPLPQPRAGQRQQWLRLPCSPKRVTCWNSEGVSLARSKSGGESAAVAFRVLALLVSRPARHGDCRREWIHVPAILRPGRRRARASWTLRLGWPAQGKICSWDPWRSLWLTSAYEIVWNPQIISSSSYYLMVVNLLGMLFFDDKCFKGTVQNLSRCTCFPLNSFGRPCSNAELLLCRLSKSVSTNGQCWGPGERGLGEACWKNWNTWWKKNLVSFSD